MRVTDLLALSHVPRWSIMSRLREQSVGDHVFRVMVIATELAERLNVELTPRDFINMLEHDADESRTGDIPTPAKDKMQPLIHCPWQEATVDTGDGYRIFMLADALEALTWIERFGAGEHAARAKAGMMGVVKGRTMEEWRTVVSQLLDDITFDIGR